MNSPKIVLRINAANPNHHIWNNNGTWWCHYTEHRPDFTKQRIRASLGTKAVAEARLRRDQLLVLRPEDSLVSASMTLIPNKIATQQQNGKQHEKPNTIGWKRTQRIMERLGA